MDQLVCLKKIILIWEKSRPPQGNRASKAPISLLSHKFDNKNNKDPLESNKTPTGPLETPSAKPFKAPEIDAIHYIKKDLQQIIPLIVQAQTTNGRSLKDKLKV